MISNKQGNILNFRNRGRRKTNNGEIKTVLFHNQRVWQLSIVIFCKSYCDNLQCWSVWNHPFCKVTK